MGALSVCVSVRPDANVSLFVSPLVDGDGTATAADDAASVRAGWEAAAAAEAAGVALLRVFGMNTLSSSYGSSASARAAACRCSSSSSRPRSSSMRRPPAAPLHPDLLLRMATDVQRQREGCRARGRDRLVERGSSMQRAAQQRGSEMGRQLSLSDGANNSAAAVSLWSGQPCASAEARRCSGVPTAADGRDDPGSSLSSALPTRVQPQQCDANTARRHSAECRVEGGVRCNAHQQMSGDMGTATRIRRPPQPAPRDSNVIAACAAPRSAGPIVAPIRMDAHTISYGAVECDAVTPLWRRLVAARVTVASQQIRIGDHWAAGCVRRRHRLHAQLAHSRRAM